MAELADAGDSKSPALRGVRVRLPLPAPSRKYLLKKRKADENKAMEASICVVVEAFWQEKV